VIVFTSTPVALSPVALSPVGVPTVVAVTSSALAK
jgi:hypothetical protein